MSHLPFQRCRSAHTDMGGISICHGPCLLVTSFEQRLTHQFITTVDWENGSKSQYLKKEGLPSFRLLCRLGHSLFGFFVIFIVARGRKIW